MYKLKHGDIIKILPIIKKDGSFSTVEELNGFYIGGKVIYDTPQNHLKTALKTKAYQEGLYQGGALAQGNYPSKLQNTKIALCIYHENQIKFTLVGKTLKDKLINSYQFDPRNNDHLKINIKLIGSYISHLPSFDNYIGHLPSFDNCEVIQHQWDKPNIDIDSQKDWLDWLKQNQPFFIEDYIESRSVFNNIDTLKQEGLTDYIYQIIADSREKKINEVMSSCETEI
jgi:hypothetical protein